MNQIRIDSIFMALDLNISVELYTQHKTSFTEDWKTFAKSGCAIWNRLTRLTDVIQNKNRADKRDRKTTRPFSLIFQLEMKK